MRKKSVEAFALALLTASAATAHADFKPLAPGQYQIGSPPIQQICLKANGRWYGTTFNFGGQWTGNSPGAIKVKAAIYGSYAVAGEKGKSFANDTITVERPKGPTVWVTWYDWYNDLSFGNLLTGERIHFVKRDCDPPFKGQNTHAATQ